MIERAFISGGPDRGRSRRPFDSTVHVSCAGGGSRRPALRIAAVPQRDASTMASRSTMAGLLAERWEDECRWWLDRRRGAAAARVGVLRTRIRAAVVAHLARTAARASLGPPT